MRSFSVVCPKLQTLALSSAPLILIYLLPLLLQLHYAGAINKDLITHQDHNHHRLLAVPETFELTGDGGTYEPDFLGADRSIIGRAATDDQALANNVPGMLNIGQGDSQFWTFPSRALTGPKSPQPSGILSEFANHTNFTETASSVGTTLYISLNTCLQPTPQSPNIKRAPDQLKLYVSTSSDNQQPSNNDNNYAVPVDGGFAKLNISSVKSDVYFGIYAPKDDGFTGGYNYELTASIDGFYASYYNESAIYFVDSDTNSALLYTDNMTNANSSTLMFKEMMSKPPPFTLFIQNQADPSLLGMQNSYCALKNLAQVQMPDIDTAVITSNNGQPQQQFHAKTLNGSSAYYAFPAVDGNSTDSGSGVVGGGGTVWSTIAFNTKSDNNCVLVFNLPFCSSVAYAAPGNPLSDNADVSNATQLGLIYDQYASALYANFSNSLAQVACNTTSSAQYSLARNCTDCANAYKEWLCAVTIPRCEDFSNQATTLQPRAISQPFINGTSDKQYLDDTLLSPGNKNRTIFNSSRNAMIDKIIAPGPYKEVLPCEDICYELVRSCPAFLSFACPLAGHGLNYSYGKPTDLSGFPPSCNPAKTGPNGAAVLKALPPLAVAAIFGSVVAVMAM